MKIYQEKQQVLWERIKGAYELWIYGAGIVAYGAYKALESVFGIYPRAFVVTEKDEDVELIEGIRVIAVEELTMCHEQALILVATPEIYHREIEKTLQNKKNFNCMYLDSDNEYLLMSLYFQKNGKFQLLKNILLDDREGTKGKARKLDVGIYMATSHLDKQLVNEVETEWFVKRIQVGKALTDTVIAELTDAIGDTISAKNRNYCELTATYWVWKNAHSAYKGICHYRRQLLVTEDEMYWVKENEIDVILPLPFVCYPNTQGQYGRYITLEDQEILFRALEKVAPDYAVAAKEILSGQYLYNYNMLIAKENVFDAYCAWMFPILFCAEQMREDIKPGVEDRFAGYFGEVLTSIYFLKNREKLNIVHVKKRWYQ